jgi:hypothetical protein
MGRIAQVFHHCQVTVCSGCLGPLGMSELFQFKRNIYQKLSTALAGDDLQAIYLQRADEILPNIRYCEYNIGDESAIKDLTDLKLKSTGSDMAENIDV